MTLPFLHADIAPHTHGFEAAPLLVGLGVAAAALVGAVLYRRRKA